MLTSSAGANGNVSTLIRFIPEVHTISSAPTHSPQPASLHCRKTRLMMLRARSGLKLRATAFARFAHPRMMSTPSNNESCTILPLPLSQPSLQEENEQLEVRTKEMTDFFAQPRFNSIKRPYTASAVALKQGSLPVLPLPGTLLADKLYKVLDKAADEGRPVHTMGAIDPVQMTQMARHQEVVYVSGWACSSVLTTGNNEVGPDLGWVVLGDQQGSVLIHTTETIPTRPYPTRCTEFSALSSSTTKNIMMSECLHLSRNEPRWSTSTT